MSLRPRSLPDGTKAIATFLGVIIDDHSRRLPFAAYFLRADPQAFPQTLQEALRRRGRPAKRYTDQGGPFTQEPPRVVCANLGLRLLHAKPDHAWSKGKAERVLFTIQQSLAAVGITRQAIEPAALNLLTSASSGLARSLGLLCRAAWIEAASAGAQTSEPPHVQAAIERVPGAAGLLPPPSAPTPT